MTKIHTASHEKGKKESKSTPNLTYTQIFHTNLAKEKEGSSCFLHWYWNFWPFLSIVRGKSVAAATAMQKRRRRTVVLLRRLLTCAIGTIALVALLSAHVQVIFPSSEVTKLPDKLPTVTVPSPSLWKWVLIARLLNPYLARASSFYCLERVVFM